MLVRAVENGRAIFPGLLEHTSFKSANDLGLRHALVPLFQILKAGLKRHEKSILKVKLSVKSITLFNL